MAASQSQHRCVFVGNIPYDASEEQLIQICEEVGPVVNFRLVVDRETGKPKGYGFCEYKDEETALSARRNLQGYEINGRQLRVDFAENDKSSDRNLEGRGGSASATNVDPARHSAGQAGSGRQSLEQPVGYSVSMAAATVMAGALGSAQTASMRNKIGLGTDSLSQHLAMMSKTQLTEIVSEFKAMATQNKEQARKLLVAMPNLAKALFQVEIMLGIASSQLLMVASSSQPAPQSSTQSVQTLTGLPPLPANKMQSAMQGQESRITTGLLNHQYAAVKQPQTPVVLNSVLQSGDSGIPSKHPGVSTSSFTQQAHHPSLLMRSQISSGSIQPASTSSTILGNMDVSGYNLVTDGTTRLFHSSTDQLGRAEKLMRLNDGRATSSPSTQAPQIQLPRDVDSVLLQQVMSLTAEQLGSLPPEERLKVMKLQQALRQVR